MTVDHEDRAQPDWFYELAFDRPLMSTMLRSLAVAVVVDGSIKVLAHEATSATWTK